MDESREPRWIDVGATSVLEAGPLIGVKAEGRRLVVGRASGAWFALDNQCPHEGYPLSTGALKEGRLTCSWHNWKFDVRDGSCLVGGEAVRSYSVREEGGRVLVDLAEVDSAATIVAARESMWRGLQDRDVGRATRDVVRMLAAGADPQDVLVDVVADDSRRAEYGSTHVLPVAADCGRVVSAGPEAIRAIAHVLELSVESNARLPARPPSPAISFAGEDFDVVGDAFRRAIEDEELDRALGIVRGAFEVGVERATVELWLARALSDHFTDFGHELIYLVKGSELLDRVDPRRAFEVWPGLITAMVYATREDTLPYLKTYFTHLGETIDPGELERLGGGTGCAHDRRVVIGAVLDAPRPREAVDAVLDALRAGSAVEEVAKDLVAAAAHRLLRFDPAHDADVDVAEGWLWATHRLTFAAAVRHAARRFGGEIAVRFLIQSVAFTHTGRPMDAIAGEVAIDPGRIEAAGADPDGLIFASLEGPLVRPIFVAHALKTSVVGLEEREAMEGHPDRDAPLAAALHFLDATPCERTTAAVAERSRRFVVEGRMPRKLTQ